MVRLFFRGRGGGVRFLALLKKKRSEIKYEKSFSTESEEQHQNLKRTEIITYMKGVTPSSTPHSLR